MIQPNETHMLKATAWDALYAAATIKFANERNHKPTEVLIALMDSLLKQTGETLADKNIWMRWGKMRKFDNEKLYYCHACGRASDKEGFDRVKVGGVSNVVICPECGSIFKLDVHNVVREPVQEADAPEPEKPEKKK